MTDAELKSIARRQAMKIASDLPLDREAALEILKMAAEMVEIDSVMPTSFQEAV